MWLLWGGVWLLRGGMHGCSGGGVHGCSRGGMCGCSGGPGGMRGCSGGGMRGFFDEILSMSRRYASYWNAFLFLKFLDQ